MGDSCGELKRHMGALLDRNLGKEAQDACRSSMKAMEFMERQSIDIVSRWISPGQVWEMTPSRGGALPYDP